MTNIENCSGNGGTLLYKYCVCNSTCRKKIIVIDKLEKNNMYFKIRYKCHFFKNVICSHQLSNAHGLNKNDFMI